MMIYNKDEETGELYHYGIKGQKWGVRRYQNEDGSYTKEGLERRIKSYGGKGKFTDFDYEKDINFDNDFILNKGTKHQRLTDTPEEDLSKNKRTYVTGTHVGEYGDYIAFDKTPYYDVLETQRDVLVAGRDTMRSILNEIGDKKVNDIIEAVSMGREEYIDKKTNQNSGAEIREKYDDKWDEYTDFLNNNKKYEKVANEFISKLKDKGYDAVIDPQDGGNNNAESVFSKDAVIYVNNVLKRVEEEWYDDEGWHKKKY